MYRNILETLTDPCNELRHAQLINLLESHRRRKLHVNTETMSCFMKFKYVQYINTVVRARPNAMLGLIFSQLRKELIL